MGYSLMNEYIQTIVKWYFAYDSLPVLLASVALFHIYRSMTISNPKYIVSIKALTPLIFGVYLIHDNPNVREYVWMGFNYELIPNDLLPISVIGYATIIFIACLVLDFCRNLLFNFIYKTESYNRLSLNLDNRVYIHFNEIYSHIFKK